MEVNLETIGLNRIDYYDSFSEQYNGTNMISATKAVFGQKSRVIDLLMRIRNSIIKLFGLTPVTLDNDRFDLVANGQLGFFNVYTACEDLVIIGQDDSHLDFRVCVHKELESLHLSTYVQYNNRLGKWYMRIISPFHKWIVKRMLRRINTI